jgi:hypothetical protein
MKLLAEQGSPSREGSGATSMSRNAGQYAALRCVAPSLRHHGGLPVFIDERQTLTDRSRRLVAALGALLLAFASVLAAGTAADAVPEASGTNVSVASSTATTPWVGTWATAMQNTSAAFTGKTLRQIVHTSIGGATARIHLSNQFNSVPAVRRSTPRRTSRSHSPGGPRSPFPRAARSSATR